MTTYLYTGIAPTSFSLAAQPNTAILTSAITQAEQSIIRPGGRFSLTVTWANVHGASLNAVLGYLDQLNGSEHRAQFRLWIKNHGAYGGTPLTDGAQTAGSNILAVRGASLSITNWAKAGDLISVASSASNTYGLHRVTADADSDGTGDVSLSVFPDLHRAYPDGRQVVIGIPNSNWVMTGAYDVSHDASNLLNNGDHRATVTASFLQDIATA